jgi:ubiquinone/menaquinone biosynthesis C-methylase UbiE
LGKHLETSSLTPLDWHYRFTQQARWTQDLRRYLFDHAGLKHARRVLDVGCGTGVLLPELLTQPGRTAFGLDLEPAFLALAAGHTPQAVLIQGDAHAMPFNNNCLDLSLCHFLLLWVADPARVVSEMKRVTRPGGSVLVLAEPDYGGRIDYPEELSQLGQLQKAALHRQGADPLMGRRLRAIMQQAGLADIETGVLGGQWKTPLSPEDFKGEWAILRSDLADSVPGDIIEHFYQLDQAAWARDERLLFVPTFYAWGCVPK